MTEETFNFQMQILKYCSKEHLKFLTKIITIAKSNLLLRRRNAIRYSCYTLSDSWGWLYTCFVMYELFSKKNHNNFVVTQEFIG